MLRKLNPHEVAMRKALLNGLMSRLPEFHKSVDVRHLKKFAMGGNTGDAGGKPSDSSDRQDAVNQDTSKPPFQGEMAPGHSAGDGVLNEPYKGGNPGPFETRNTPGHSEGDGVLNFSRGGTLPIPEGENDWGHTEGNGKLNFADGGPVGDEAFDSRQPGDDGKDRQLDPRNPKYKVATGYAEGGKVKGDFDNSGESVGVEPRSPARVAGEKGEFEGAGESDKDIDTNDDESVLADEGNTDYMDGKNPDVDGRDEKTPNEGSDDDEDDKDLTFEELLARVNYGKKPKR